MTDRRYLFLGERLNSIPEFARLPSAAGLYVPKAVYPPRQYTAWSTAPASRAEPVAKAEPTAAGILPVVTPVSKQEGKTAVTPTPEKNEETAVNPDGNKTGMMG